MNTIIFDPVQAVLQEPATHLRPVATTSAHRHLDLGQAPPSYCPILGLDDVIGQKMLAEGVDGMREAPLSKDALDGGVLQLRKRNISVGICVDAGAQCRIGCYCWHY